MSEASPRTPQAWQHKCCPPEVFVLSTVEFSRFNTTGTPECEHGRQESNLRHPDLEAGALTELSYTHRKLLEENENAARPGNSRKGGVSRVERVYVCRRAG